MHGTEYTARIKALIAAKEAAEENMKRVLFQFRNGRKPNPADVTDARNYWAEALAVVDPEDAEQYVFPESSMRARLELLAQEAIGELEASLQRDEAEVFYGENRAVIIAPGEEGLYPGVAITVYANGTRLSTVTGNWVDN